MYAMYISYGIHIALQYPVSVFFMFFEHKSIYTGSVNNSKLSMCSFESFNDFSLQKFGYVSLGMLTYVRLCNMLNRNTSIRHVHK